MLLVACVIHTMRPFVQDISVLTNGAQNRVAGIDWSTFHNSVLLVKKDSSSLSVSSILWEHRLWQLQHSSRRCLGVIWQDSSRGTWLDFVKGEKCSYEEGSVHVWVSSPVPPVNKLSFGILKSVSRTENVLNVIVCLWDVPKSLKARALLKRFPSYAKRDQIRYFIQWPGR
jgi:hypothetical protein